MSSWDTVKGLQNLSASVEGVKDLNALHTKIEFKSNIGFSEHLETVQNYLKVSVGIIVHGVALISKIDSSLNV